jgi:hypothetical protein
MQAVRLVEVRGLCGCARDQSGEQDHHLQAFTRSLEILSWSFAMAPIDILRPRRAARDVHVDGE